MSSFKPRSIPARRAKESRLGRDDDHFDYPPAPRQADLISYGWCRRDAEALGVVELALDVGSDLADKSLQVLVGHVEAALALEPVFLGAIQLLGTAEHAPMWWRMSRLTQTPAMRQRMATLASHGEGFDTVTVDSPEAFAELLTPEDMRRVAAAVTAESRGEFATALELLRSVPMRTDDAWMDSLRIICAHEDAPDPLLLGRFVCLAAYRSILRAPGLQEVIAHLATVVRLASGQQPAELSNHPLMLATEHPAIRDAVLFDAGGLASYVMGTLARRVVEQVPGIQEWAETAPSVVRIEANLGDGLIRCHDLVTRDKVLVSAEGLADAEPVGTCVFGRLVRLTEREHSFFALQPIGLDTMTATRVAAAIAAGSGAEERLTELCRGLATRMDSQATNVA